ncbi:MAG: acyltransferase domain-containing protein, partial [Gammaproteobacteria bacterium]|nr:acyltransferase domain-containing protein [Gammaproteobacteria bacterium]
MNGNDNSKQLMLEKYEPIAIVGIGLRYPGNSSTLDEFSEFLYEGRSGIVDIPDSRWDLAAYYSDDPQAKGKTVQSKGGFLDQIDEFDPKFFNISPKEANYCDPQHRLLLECSWNALESANIDPITLRDSNGGVYIGIAQFDYGLNASRLSAEDLAGNIGTGTAHSAACGRLSYFLGWRGPCMSIDTACSSSLVALHIAVQGLRRHECDIALCGGVNAIHHPRNHIVFSQSNMLSADGYCKTFDDSADGYSRSEGCGVLVLKRLSDAKHDGDRILALVRGSAVAQDGESGGLTVPNGIAQVALMREALKSGLLEPKDIQYVEAHGTGTSLGDPIEVGAINSVFAESHTRKNPIKIGSIKSNLGHMEAGAGTCGIIKVVQQLQNGLFYPHVNLKTPSRHIPWDSYIVSVPTEVQPWDADRRRGMVNSFGFAGSIACVVLEQAPPQTSSSQTSASEIQQDEFPIFTVSAKNAAALRLQVKRYQQFICETPDIELGELCYTANVGRVDLNARFAVGVTSLDELGSQLDSYLAENRTSDNRSGEFRGGNVAFLFTGQGSQYIGMGKALYTRYPVFRRHVDKCDQLFEPHLGCSIKALIFGLKKTAEIDIHQTLYTQPSLFVLEYAMARLWMSWGIKPSVLLGHSIGEIVAATIAGLFSLADGIKLVAARARLMQSVSAKGGMVAVQAKVNDVTPLLKGYDDVSFGAINGPQQCVISGGVDSLQKIKATLDNNDIKTKILPVSNGFHSPLMAEILDPFQEVLSGITFNDPELSFISNLTGKVVTVNDVGNAEYWLRHMSEPVNFIAGMQCIQSRGKHVFIEVGPSPALTNMGKQCVKQRDHLWVFSLNPEINGDCQTLQTSLAKAYTAGLTISWQGYHHQGRSHRKIDLPLYEFDRKQYWLPDSKALLTAGTTTGMLHHSLLGPEITSNDNGVSGTREFCTNISPNYPSYLADHVVMGQVVFPGAGYVEMLFALQDAIFGETAHLIRDMNIIEPLFLSEETMTPLHTRVQKTPNGDSTVEIFSRIDGRAGSIERIHVTATLAGERHGENNRERDTESCLAEIFDRLQAFSQTPTGLEHQHRIDDVYAQYSELGLPYGPEFRRIQSLFQYDNRIAIGQLRGFNTPAAEHLPPFILDCAMQALAGVVNIENTYLPVSFANIQLLKKPKGELDVVIQLTSSKEKSAVLTADIVVTENNRPVFIVNKLMLKRVTNSSASRRLYHTPRWFKRSLTSNQLALSAARHVLVVNRSQSDFDSITSLLDDARVQLNFAADIVGATQCISEQESITDLCWFWKTQLDLSGEARLRAECEQNYKELLTLVSALAELGYGRELKIMLVTEGAQWLPGDSANDRSEEALSASSLWGFGHVMLNEYPAVQTVLVDLPPSANAAVHDYRVLLEEWSANVQG